MITEKLTAKYRRAAELAEELRRSLALEELCPGVFSYGAVKTYWILKPQPRWAYMRPTFNRFLQGVFVVIDGDGVERRFEAVDVPEVFKCSR